MKRATHIMLALVVGAWVLNGTGCASQSMKDANRRLKESNDRLISENNRLEDELATLQQRVNDVSARSVETAAVMSNDPAPAPNLSDIERSLLLDDDVVVTSTDDGVRIRIPDRVFFAPGQAKLTSRGQTVLRKVGQLLKNEYPGNVIRVDGHTDDTPIRKVRNVYPTNWELSTGRACSVVRFLVDECNVDVKSVFPAGFSYYRPVSFGRTSNARQQNRRVEIMVLNKRV